MEGVTLDLFPSTDTPGQNLKPLLSIRAERVTRTGGDLSALSFEGARAIVPARTPEAREIEFSADRGEFMEGKSAMLDGNVIARINDMIIELEAITWEIVPGEGGSESGGVATSERPLRITSPNQNLTASGLRLDTAAEIIELRDVDGEFTFVGDTP